MMNRGSLVLGAGVVVASSAWIAAYLLADLRGTVEGLLLSGRRIDLLCIDELGYMQLDRRGAEMLFQVITEREGTNSIPIASNQAFSGWTDTFTDPRLCAAIIDRLIFAGLIIETATRSYRRAHARARRVAAS
ncbi:ATP-binding protein [Pseudonocardia sp. TMWB2A]|uniref:ATP-binding protein n=1 Tax=Pseudonocardia sp. TMWB2A TaxID=687430 RepID=UPI00307CCC7F